MDIYKKTASFLFNPKKIQSPNWPLEQCLYWLSISIWIERYPQQVVHFNTRRKSPLPFHAIESERHFYKLAERTPVIKNIRILAKALETISEPGNFKA